MAIAPAGFKGHGAVLIERAAALAIKHGETNPLDGAAAGPQGLATSRWGLGGFGMGAQQMLNRLGIPCRQGKCAVSRPHQLLSRDRRLGARNQWPTAVAVRPSATGACRGLGHGSALEHP